MMTNDDWAIKTPLATQTMIIRINCLLFIIKFLKMSQFMKVHLIISKYTGRMEYLHYIKH